MKKLLSVLLALVMLAACSAAAAEQETRKIETAADADEFIAGFLGEHPEELDGVWTMTAQMEAALGQLGGLSGMAKQLFALGALEKAEPAREGELQGYQTFTVPCRFSMMPVDIVLVVQDGAIAGLQTATYSGDSEETSEPEQSEAFDSIALALPVPALGELPGILTLPKGEGPFPAVVLIHGSGVSDKDESVGNLKPFRDLAEGLAAQGVAVYRFDKRSYVYGVQMASDKQITLVDESIEDAVNAVQLLAGQDRIDPARILVLGHSLGGTAIPAIARALDEAPVKACGFIMMAATPRSLDVISREQIGFLQALGELTDEEQEQYNSMLQELDKLQNLDSLPEEETIMGVYVSYWKWLADYDILQAAEEIAQPVLLLQGEEDYQVTMEDFGIWKEALGEKENWQMKSYPGLIHPFTAGLKAEGSAAYMKDEKMDAQVILDITEFVNGIR